MTELPAGDERAPRLWWGMWKRFLLAGVLIAFFAGATTATAILLEVKDVTERIDTGGRAINLPSGVVTRAQAGAPQTLLVIGSDRRYRDRKDVHNARSDTIMLVRLDPDARATTVMSIPRDLKVRLRRGAPPDKINAAYSVGGPAMTAKVVKRVLSSPGQPLTINHVVNVNFGGFRAVVNRLGCVFTDVDRNYFNDNNPPNGGGAPYATISIKPGYQRLCGSDALDYVRFRHLDTDIVRAARQQDFLRQAKDQYGTGRLLSNRRQLATIFGHYTQSDRELHRTAGILKLLDLVIFSGRKPIQEVHFPAILGDATDPFVTAQPSAVRRAVRRFLAGGGRSAAAGAGSSARPPGGARRAARRAGRRRGVPGLVNAAVAGESQGARIAAHARFPVYYPKLITARGQYMGPVAGVYPRAYLIRVGRHWRHAYRMVIDAGGIGEFYGVQGTTWQDPPLLRGPDAIRRVAGRRLLLYEDGGRLRFVAWRTRRAVYWISNTLLESLSNRQMLAIAASLTPIGSR